MFWSEGIGGADEWKTCPPHRSTLPLLVPRVSILLRGRNVFLNLFLHVGVGDWRVQDWYPKCPGAFAAGNPAVESQHPLLRSECEGATVRVGQEGKETVCLLTWTLFCISCLVFTIALHTPEVYKYTIILISEVFSKCSNCRISLPSLSGGALVLRLLWYRRCPNAKQAAVRFPSFCYLFPMPQTSTNLKWNF